MNESLRALILSVLDDVTRGSSGRALTHKSLRKDPVPGSDPLRLLAIGKAAPSMALGVLDGLGDRIQDGLVICHQPEVASLLPRFHWVQGDHPLPGQRSFEAGSQVCDWARRAREDGSNVLVLLSGGASAIAESPAPGTSERELTSLYRELVASGRPIEEINLERGRRSALKAGGLASMLGDALVDVRVLVDVPSGVLDVVGSGPCLGAASHYKVGDPGVLIELVRQALAARDVAPVRVETPRAWRLEDLAARLTGHLERGAGAWVSAGEAIVALPPDLLQVAAGGRAQHVALEVMNRLGPGVQGSWALLAWASDGLDGSGGSGALITHDDLGKLSGTHLGTALARFQSGSLLEEAGCRLKSFASETNLTDLYLAVRN